MTILTKKFSQFAIGGNLEDQDITVGLRTGVNTQFENFSVSTVWNNVTESSMVMVPNQGFLANNSSLVTLFLPAIAPFGTVIYIQGFGAGGWIIEQNDEQNIHIGSISSTVGVGGSVASTNQLDSMVLVCAVANTTFCLLGGPQSSGLFIT